LKRRKVFAAGLAGEEAGVAPNENTLDEAPKSAGLAPKEKPPGGAANENVKPFTVVASAGLAGEEAGVAPNENTLDEAPESAGFAPKEKPPGGAENGIAESGAAVSGAAASIPASHSLPPPKFGPGDMYLGSSLNFDGDWNILPQLPNILLALAITFALAMTPFEVVARVAEGAVAAALTGVEEAAIILAKSADVSLMPFVSQGRAGAAAAGFVVGVLAGGVEVLTERYLRTEPKRRPADMYFGVSPCVRWLPNILLSTL